MKQKSDLAQSIENLRRTLQGRPNMAFDEKALRDAIIGVWGEHGAHIDLYDALLKENETLRAKIQDLATDLLEAYEGAEND